MNQDNSKLKVKIVNFPFFYGIIFFSLLPIILSELSVAGKLLCFCITLAVMTFLAFHNRKLILKLYRENEF